MRASEDGRLRKLIAVVSLALLAGAGLLWGRQAQPPSRVVQTVVRDAGYFYRFKAGFEVKATGERLDFDTVVACNIRVTRWRDGGLSDDTTISPKVMIKATAGGQAVMLYTLRGCSGLTSEDEDVPPDVLPLAIWFDSVEDFSNGLAYVSEDAYDSPRGKLVFHGARIERATRADWEAWRKAAADEYVERGALPGPWGYDYPGQDQRHGLVRYVSSCEG
jgi:hypothetical protein